METCATAALFRRHLSVFRAIVFLAMKNFGYRLSASKSEYNVLMDRKQSEQCGKAIA
jgi:hypothetical protein